MTTAYTTGLYGLAALMAAIVGGTVVVLVRGRASVLPALACGATALWALLVAMVPENAISAWPAVLETVRTATWLLLLIGLGRSVGAGQLSPTEKRFLALGLLVATVALSTLLLPYVVIEQWPVLALLSVLARVSLLLLIVLVAENLYRNADEATRWHVNLPCIVLGSLAAVDVVIYADASLSRGDITALLDARAVLTTLALPLLGIGALRARRLRRQPGISRQFAFHGATLIVAGAFLIAVGLLGETIRRTGAEWSDAAQIALMTAAIMAMLVALTSQSARSRIKWFVMDHFFAARFDYRHEWLRTIGILAGADGAEPEPVRAVRAIADAVDSPSGVLLRCEPGDRSLRWAGSWNCASAPVVLSAEHAWLDGFADGSWIQFVGDDAPSELRAAFGPLWLAVPLPHHRDGMIGVVLLARPRAAFSLNRESFDLLRMLGREVALFLAERRAAERLVEQRRVEDYAKRFAFVAHDIKNVSNQLTLVLANAERNVSNPEFQRDMLFTIRGSVERINTLIARLKQPAASDTGSNVAVAVLPRLRALARAHLHPVLVELSGENPGLAAIDPEHFETAVTHVLNNAVEASMPGNPVRIVVHRADGVINVDISDRGAGMSPEFVRDELFRPLATSKPSGTGIGAWQARELLTGSGATLSVHSEVGAGTTVRLTLPAFAAQSTSSLAKEQLT